MGPEGTDVDTDDLGRVDDLAQGPHEGTVHSHQLLRLDLVCLVEHHPHLVLMVLECLDDLRELVRDVQLVGVKEQDDAVHAFGEPLQDSRKVIACGESWSGKGLGEVGQSQGLGAESEALSPVSLYTSTSELLASCSMFTHHFFAFLSGKDDGVSVLQVLRAHYIRIYNNCSGNAVIMMKS